MESQRQMQRKVNNMSSSDFNWSDSNDTQIVDNTPQRYIMTPTVPQLETSVLFFIQNILAAVLFCYGYFSCFFSYRKCISIDTDCSSVLLQDHVIVTTKIYSVARFANYYCCQNIRKYTPNHTLGAPASPYSNQEYFILLRNKSILLP